MKRYLPTKNIALNSLSKKYDEESVQEAMSHYPDELLRNKQLDQNAIATPGEFVLGASSQDNDPNMISTEYSHMRAKMEAIMPHQGGTA